MTRMYLCSILLPTLMVSASACCADAYGARTLAPSAPAFSYSSPDASIPVPSDAPLAFKDQRETFSKQAESGYDQSPSGIRMETICDAGCTHKPSGWDPSLKPERIKRTDRLRQSDGFSTNQDSNGQVGMSFG